MEAGPDSLFPPASQPGPAGITASVLSPLPAWPAADAVRTRADYLYIIYDVYMYIHSMHTLHI